MALMEFCVTAYAHLDQLARFPMLSLWDVRITSNISACKVLSGSLHPLAIYFKKALRLASGQLTFLLLKLYIHYRYASSTGMYMPMAYHIFILLSDEWFLRRCCTFNKMTHYFTTYGLILYTQVLTTYCIAWKLL